MTRFRPSVVRLETRAVPAAQLQVIHNAPFASAAAVDVYVNNTLLPELTNLKFRGATPFLTVPSATPLVVSVRGAGATASTPPVFTQTFNLADNSKNIAVALGDPAQTSGTAVTKFQLLANTAARTQAAAAGKAEFVVVHGSPDAPPVDVKVRGVGTIVNDVTYPSFATEGYVSVAPGKYTVDVTLADGVSRVGSYAADLTGAANKAVTVLASGFVGTLPSGTAAANTFGLLAVNSDGTTALLPAASPPPLGTGLVAAGGGTAARFDFTGKAGATATPFAGGGGVRAVTADVTGDGVADLVVGSAPGSASQVQVIDGATQKVVFSGQPFETSFTGGVFVTAGDLTGDGRADLVVTPDQGGGPVVVVYDGSRLAPPGSQPLVAAEVARFLGIEDAGFRGGARAAVGDVNGDGTPDLVVAAGFGGGPRVAIYNGKTVLAPVGAGQVPARLVGDFFVFEQSLRNGVFVTAGDVNGDGSADVLVGGGPGGGPRVFGLSGKDLVAGKQVTVADFFAGPQANRDGVRLAAKDLDGDLNADLVVGLGAAGTAQVRGFRGKDFAASVTGTTPPAVSGLDLNPFTNPGLVYVG